MIKAKERREDTFLWVGRKRNSQVFGGAVEWGGEQLLVSEQDLFNPQAHPPLDPAVTQLWCLLESFSVKQKVLHLPGR